ncbi:unnamed protein product [Symbiodinium sp. CCMP2592]|nr:unnamed protein product [Symbiodinium sp. CCMP2592]
MATEVTAGQKKLSSQQFLSMLAKVQKERAEEARLEAQVIEGGQGSLSTGASTGPTGPAGGYEVIRPPADAVAPGVIRPPPGHTIAPGVIRPPPGHTMAPGAIGPPGHTMAPGVIGPPGHTMPGVIGPPGHTMPRPGVIRPPPDHTIAPGVIRPPPGHTMAPGVIGPPGHTMPRPGVIRPIAPGVIAPPDSTRRRELVADGKTIPVADEGEDDSELDSPTKRPLHGEAPLSAQEIRELLFGHVNEMKDAWRSFQGRLDRVEAEQLQHNHEMINLRTRTHALEKSSSSMGRNQEKASKCLEDLTEDVKKMKVQIDDLQKKSASKAPLASSEGSLPQGAPKSGTVHGQADPWAEFFRLKGNKEMEFNGNPPRGDVQSGADFLSEDEKRTLVVGGWARDTKGAVIEAESGVLFNLEGIKDSVDAEKLTIYGPRRSVGMLKFLQREGESYTEVKNRMWGVIKLVANSKIELASTKELGEPRNMWASFVKTKAARAKSSLVSLTRRVCCDLAMSSKNAEGGIKHLLNTQHTAYDCDWNMGTIWCGSHKLASATHKAPRECEVILLPSGWVASEAEDLLSGRSPKATGEVLPKGCSGKGGKDSACGIHRWGRVVSWNLGGQSLKMLDVAAADADILLVQEVSRGKDGWDGVETDEYHWIVHRHREQWRGTAVGIAKDRLDCVIRKVASPRGVWVLARIHGLGRVVCGSIHCYTGVTNARYQAAVGEFFALLPAEWRRYPLLCGVDANEEPCWTEKEMSEELEVSHCSDNLNVLLDEAGICDLAVFTLIRLEDIRSILIMLHSLLKLSSEEMCRLDNGETTLEHFGSIVNFRQSLLSMMGMLLNVLRPVRGLDVHNLIVTVRRRSLLSRRPESRNRKPAGRECTDSGDVTVKLGRNRDCHAYSLEVGTNFELCKMKRKNDEVGGEACLTAKLGHRPDGISVHLLREMANHESLSVQLLQLINHIVEKQETPEIWNVSFLALLAKCSQPLKPSDLRPICVSSAFNKLVNRLVCARALPFLRRGSKISACGRGRQAADLIGAVSRIRDVIHEWRMPALVCKLDVAGAFDRVDRRKMASLLIARLKDTGRIVELRYLLGQLHSHLLEGRVPGGGKVRLRPNTGIKQGAPESAELFGILIDSLLSELVDSSSWRSLGGLADDFDVDLLFYQDDVFLVDCQLGRLVRRIRVVDRCLGQAGLKLATNKTKIIASRNYSGPRRAEIGGDCFTIAGKDESIKVLGVSFNFFEGPSQQAQEMLGRARAAVAAHSDVLCASGPWMKKVEMLRCLVEGAWSWTAGALHWSAQDLMAANTLQLHTLRKMFALKRLRNEVSRWSAKILALQHNLHGHWVYPLVAWAAGDEFVEWHEASM